MAVEMQISYNETLKRFEYTEDGITAFVEFKMVGKSIAFTHTIVPKALEGKGVASALAAYAFNYAKEQQMPVIVNCSYIAQYVKKHPELDRQLDKQFDF